MHAFIQALIDNLKSHKNQIGSMEEICALLTDFYTSKKRKIYNDEYSFIIRHITTPSLRSYFNYRANAHNEQLSPKNFKKLRFSMHPLILNSSEQENYSKALKEFKERKTNRFDISGPNMIDLRTIVWIRSELDSNWYYIGVAEPQNDVEEDDEEANVCRSLPSFNVQLTLGGRRGRRIDEKERCCVCNSLFHHGWCYTINNKIYYMCSTCKQRFHDQGYINFIKTPMK